MKAIFKKELRSYFCSPIGYVFIAIFFFVAALFFAISNLLSGYADVSYVFSNMTMIFLFLTPILTMRLLSEEKNSKTDQLLLTSPVKVSSVVLGKLFAAVAVLGIALATTIIFPLIISAYTTSEWGKIFGNYIGFCIMGATFVSIGLYISSLTENQIIAAVSTFGVLFLLYLIEWFGDTTANVILRTVISSLAITSKFTDFAKGVINIQSVIYYVSIISIFVMLTIGQIEKKRWIK